MIRNRFRLASLVVLYVVLQSAATFAQSDVSEPEMSVEVRAWFIALTKVNHPRFKNVIAENAKIELRDQGVILTREEFLDSLGKWDKETRGAILLSQVISSVDGKDIVDICLRFDDSERLNRETFQYANGKITSMIREPVGNRCDGF